MLRRSQFLLFPLAAACAIAAACGYPETEALPAQAPLAAPLETPPSDAPEPVRDAVRDASTVTAEEKADRERFGWPNDVDVLDQAQADTLARDLGGEPHPPFPMTNGEYRHYAAMTAAVLAADPVIDQVLEEYAADITGVEVDMTKPKLGLTVTYKRDRDPQQAIEALRKRLGDIVVTAQVVSLSAADLDEMWRRITKGEGSYGKFDGITISDLRLADDPTGLLVIVAEADRIQDAEARAVFEERLREYLTLPDDVSIAVVAATSGSDRTNDAGQMKAGLRIESTRGVCTSNVGATMAGVRGFLTAKHCVQLGLTVSFNGRVIGQPTALGSCENCADDWAFVTVPRAGLASEYAFIQLAANADVRVEPVTSTATSPPVGTAACFEGSSPYRSGNVVCGSIAQILPSGTLRATFGSALCKGDSGGLLRNGGQPFGMLSYFVFDYVGQTCKAEAYFVPLANMAAKGVQIIRWNPGPASWLNLRVQHSSLCLDAYAGGVGTQQTHQWTCGSSAGGNTGQAWRFLTAYSAASSPSYYVRRRDSYDCLTRTNQYEPSGNERIEQRTCADSASQKFVLGWAPANDPFAVTLQTGTGSMAIDQGSSSLLAKTVRTVYCGTCQSQQWAITGGS